MAHQADRAQRPGNLPCDRDDPVGEGVDRGLVSRGNEREAELELVENEVRLRADGDGGSPKPWRPPDIPYGGAGCSNTIDVPRFVARPSGVR